MAHIHEKIDFVVSIFIVHNQKVLFIHHRQLDMWLPVGGHIELDEDPEQAAYREAFEESGLHIKILGEKPQYDDERSKSLYAPTFLNIHHISPTHQHVALTYIATADTDEVILAADEHHDIRWLDRAALDDLQYDLRERIKVYAVEALNRTA